MPPTLPRGPGAQSRFAANDALPAIAYKNGRAHFEENMEGDQNFVGGPTDTDAAVASALRALRVRARIPGMAMPWESGMAGVVFRAVPLFGALGEAPPLMALRLGRVPDVPDAATSLQHDQIGRAHV